MSEILSNAYNIDDFRKHGHRLVDTIADYLINIQRPDSQEKVLDYVEPEELYSRWSNDLGKGPQKNLDEFFQQIIHDSTHMHHPKYMGHQSSNVSPFSALGEFVSCVLDPGMGVYEQGTSGVALERLMAKELAKLMGWGENADGFFTSGGTLGNLTGLLSARQAMINEDVWENGYNGKQYGFMVSSEAHYSIARAIKIMGMGSRGIVMVPVNKYFQMEAEKLGECYQKATDEGIHIIGVVASSCSTSTGSYDPLEAIAEFCQNKKLWLHVDGAHGACVLFSNKHKHLVKGIEYADSVILDFHKMLMTPKLVTAVVFRKAAHSYQTFSQKAAYLWDKDKGQEWFNLARRTFELTKSFMSVKVYTLWRTFGTELFEEYVDRQYELTKSFANVLSQQEDFEVLVEHPESNILCYRYRKSGWSEERTEKMNLELRQRLLNDGEFFIIQTRVEGRLFLRSTLMNPKTTINELLALIEKIRAIIHES